MPNRLRAARKFGAQMHLLAKTCVAMLCWGLRCLKMSGFANVSICAIVSFAKLCMYSLYRNGLDCIINNVGLYIWYLCCENELVNFNNLDVI